LRERERERERDLKKRQTLAISHNCWADIKLNICKMISWGNSKKGIVPIIFHSKESLLDFNSASQENEKKTHHQSGRNTSNFSIIKGNIDN
jgi:hypothetical protein